MNLGGLSLADAAEVSQVVAGFASAIALLGLFFVWKQVRLQQDNSRVELITGLTTLIIEIDRVFIDHPEMWKYFNDCEPTPPKGETKGDRVRVVAMTMANVLDHIVEHRRKMKCETRDSWLRYIAEAYEKSPVLQEVLAEHDTWWPALQRQIREGAVKPFTPTRVAGARPA